MEMEFATEAGSKPFVVAGREGPSGVRIDNHLDGSPRNSVVTDSGEQTKQLSVLTTVGHHRISGRAT